MQVWQNTREREREEVKLKYPGRTDGHRPVWHHVYSHLWAGGVCSRIGFVSLQETLHTQLLQEHHKGLAVAAFPAPPKISQQCKTWPPWCCWKTSDCLPSGLLSAWKVSEIAIPEHYLGVHLLWMLLFQSRNAFLVWLWSLVKANSEIGWLHRKKVLKLFWNNTQSSHFFIRYS